MDDYRKVIEKNSRGLPSRWKYSLAVGVRHRRRRVPLYDCRNPDRDYPDRADAESVEIQGIFFVVLTYFVIVGSSNAVNLTDGLDGLAIMPTVWLPARWASSATCRAT